MPQHKPETTLWDDSAEKPWKKALQLLLVVLLVGTFFHGVYGFQFAGPGMQDSVAVGISVLDPGSEYNTINTTTVNWYLWASTIAFGVLSLIYFGQETVDSVKGFWGSFKFVFTCCKMQDKDIETGFRTPFYFYKGGGSMSD